jgi:signal transduction histidine kinase
VAIPALLVDDKPIVGTRSHGKLPRCTPASNSRSRGRRGIRAHRSQAVRDVTRDDFAMLIHELRNPMATISVYTQLLLQDPGTNGLAIRNIRESGLRPEGLIGESQRYGTRPTRYGALKRPMS